MLLNRGKDDKTAAEVYRINAQVAKIDKMKLVVNSDNVDLGFCCLAFNGKIVTHVVLLSNIKEIKLVWNTR
jgi:hypothetical protein